MSPPSTTTLVEVTTPAPRDTWEAIVARNPSALPSQTPVWLDAVCAHGPWEDASRLYVTGDGRPLVLPMVRRMGRPRNLAGAHSMPSTWGNGGLLAADALRAEDVAAVVADLRAGPALRTTVRPDFERAPQWTPVARAAGAQERAAVHHVLALDGDFELIWSRFASAVRRAVRKAEKEQVIVERGHDHGAVREFYRLYEGWIDHRARQRGIPLPIARRMGRTNEPLPRLLTLSDALGKDFTVWVARLDGVAIAAMITVVQGGAALSWRVTSNREVADRVRAIDLLHRHAIEHAVLRGARYYDMGESGGVESLMRFKTRFGATPRDVPTFMFERLPISAVTRPVSELRNRAEQTALAVVGRLRAGRGSSPRG